MNESTSDDKSVELPEKIEIQLEVGKQRDDIVTEKDERKKNEKVISGEAIRRKKPLGARFKNVFFGGDAKSVAENVINDVLLPAAKEMISDAFSRTVDGMLFGDRDARSDTRRRRGSAVSNITSAVAGHIQYNRMSQQNSRRDDYPRSRSRFRSRDEFDDILVPSRRDADDVLIEMEKIIRKYNFASRADLLELVGREDDIEYTDRSWGWSDLRDAASRRVAGGAYLLEMPPQERRDRA